MAEKAEGDSRWPSMGYLAKATITVGLAIALLLAAFEASGILVLLIIAIVFAVGLDPAVQILQKRFHVKRGTAVGIIFVGATSFVLLFIWLVVPPLIGQVTELADDIPAYVADLQERNDGLGKFLSKGDLEEKIKDFVSQIPQAIASSFGTIVGVTGAITGVLFNTLTVVVLTIYFMLALPRMRKTASLLFAAESREQAERVIDESVAKIGGYVSGNFVTSGVCAILAGIALIALGVPFAVPLALWAGLADLIPQVGSYLGAAPAIIVAFFDSPLLAVAVLVYFIVYQQFENYFLVPRVMKNAVDLSAAAVLVSTLIGASLAGFAGALLALPVAATIKVVVVEIWLGDRLRDAEAKDHPPEERKRRRLLRKRLKGGTGARE
ncbi:MAG: AI-2E family transporter [Actinomycetota bacterium]